MDLSLLSLGRVSYVRTDAHVVGGRVAHVVGSRVAQVVGSGVAHVVGNRDAHGGEGDRVAHSRGYSRALTASEAT